MSKLHLKRLEGGLLIVESPAKACTIGRYLGTDFLVLASYGHVRDLAEKDNAVNPNDNFAMKWEISVKHRKHLDTIAIALKNTDRLYLATDPDREGEAIAWHLYNTFIQNGILKSKDVKRITFHEITPKAVKNALDNPRNININLVNAYRARRGLDHLVGFRLSPILWRKMPGSRSAGRVQSATLRLICERETEIETFISREYWQITGQFSNKNVNSIQAKLLSINKKKLDKFVLPDETTATKIFKLCINKNYSITDKYSREENRSPVPPFNTSTLQQESSRYLHFSITQTMRLAQKLYEGLESTGGLITYMRTDGITISSEAIQNIREFITDNYGAEYLPYKSNHYKNKSKNAQESHEAIRPTDPKCTPESLSNKIDKSLWQLYQLIWQRAIASQMVDAKVLCVNLDITSEDNVVTFRATGQSEIFPGYRKVYKKHKLEKKEDDNIILPLICKGDFLLLRHCKPSQHFTQSPPRYSEASLVKKMERIGIGRPSTYASTLKILQDRGYVKINQRQIVPEDRGRLVITFLSGYFSRYIDYDFTAELENQLDQISNGNRDWLLVMHTFWNDFSRAITNASKLTLTEVRDHIDTHLGVHFFRDKNKTETEMRTCPSCTDGRLQLVFSRYGLFVGCNNYPICRYMREPNTDHNNIDHTDHNKYPINLGNDPDTSQSVLLNKGPYGFYVQLGYSSKKNNKKPKRIGLELLKNIEPNTITLSTALSLLALPRNLGLHPETGKNIKVGVGKFGPYILTEGKYTSLPTTDSVLDIELDRALLILKNKEYKKFK